MKDNWTEEIRERLSDYEMDVPDGLWESLGVDKPAARNVWRRKFATAAAAISILTTGTAYLIWESQQQPLTLDEKKFSTNCIATQQNRSATSDYPKSASKENETPIPKPMKKTGLIASLPDKEATGESSETNEDNSIAYIDPAPPTETKTHATETLQPIERVPKENHQSSDESIYRQLQHKQKPHRSATDRYALTISASGIGSISNATSATLPSYNGPLQGGDFSTGIPDTDKPGDDTNSSEVVEMHHHLPIKLGVAIQYKLTERIGIESGLTYTGSDTDITLSKGSLTYSGTRKLHYIGIPISLKYSAWSWKFINVYLSAGVAGEKCVSNKFESKSKTDDISLNTFSQQRAKPFQWSATGAAGLQLSPTPTLGIFVEPGVSYYFDDGSSLPTIYKEHPCNFNLNLGIRINLNP